MNGSQIINMIMRLVMRRGINSAINAGVRQATKPRAQAVKPEISDADMAEKQRIRAERRARRAARNG